MLTNFQTFFTIAFFMKFATKFLSYISPHFTLVTSLLNTNDRIWQKIMLHVT